MHNFASERTANVQRTYSERQGKAGTVVPNRIEKIRLKAARLIAPESSLVIEHVSGLSGVWVNEGGVDQIHDATVHLQPADTLDLAYTGGISTQTREFHVYNHSALVTTTEPIDLHINAEGEPGRRIFYLRIGAQERLG